MRFISAAQQKQAVAYIRHQQYRKMLKTDDNFGDNGKGIISYYDTEGNAKPFLYFIEESTWINKIR